MKQLKTLVKYVAAVAVIASSLFLDSCSSSKPLTQEQIFQKELRARADSIKAEEAFQAVANHQFIATADQINLFGRTFMVNPGVNYVSLNGEQAVIQLVSTHSVYAGPNGMGGVTLKGNASDIKLNYDKKGNLSMSMRVTGNGISSEATIQMAKGSDRAVVIVKGTFSSRPVTMYCDVQPYDGTGYVQGTSL